MINLGLHSQVLLRNLGIENLNITIPMALTGPQGHSMNFNAKYFSQLTKKQVTLNLLDLMKINLNRSGNCITSTELIMNYLVTVQMHLLILQKIRTKGF